jgi:hypothetical protein
MQAAEIASQVVAVLAPVVSGGVGVAQEVATKALGDLIAQRLSGNDQGRQAWQDFRVNPQNDSLIRYLLGQELADDADFRQQVERALQGIGRRPSPTTVKQSMTGTQSGNFQVGGSTGHINTGGGTISTSHVRNNNTTNKKKSSAGVIAIVVVAIVALVIYGGIKAADHMLQQTKDAGLTANSTCQQFLNTDEDDERQALADIGISEGYSAYSNPLALPEVQYECGSTPTMTLGALIQRDGNMGM